MNDRDRHVLDRRRFLELSGFGSLWLLSGLPAPAEQVAPPRQYGVYRTLAPGAVQPERWLRLYLQKQVDQLTGHYSEISWPFTEEFWSGQETPPEANAWWPWEQRAYWIDAAMRCALILHDDRLRAQVLRAVEYTLGQAAQNEGYLGPKFARDPKNRDARDGYWRWPQTVFFRALIAYAESSGDKRIAEALRQHYLGDRTRVIYGNSGRDVTNVEGMLWAYQQTGDERLLAMARQAWAVFLQSTPPGDHDSGDLAPDRVWADAPIDAHGVTYAEKSKLPALLFSHSGDVELLRYSLAAQERVFGHHMLVDGIPSASESYRGTTALDAHETCDISDHMWTWGYLLFATGDGIWGDRIERACFNAGFGAVKKDWKAVQYFSAPNQVIATSTSSQVPYMEEAVGWMAYRPNPGEDTACCGPNSQRFFPNYIIRMWLVDSQGGLAAALYGASTVKTRLGVEREEVVIREETDYPFEETIRFVLKMARPVEFPLSLRIPTWCKNPSLTLNGEPIALPPIRAKGFVTLKRLFKPGDRLNLELPMQITLTQWADDGVAIERGPLVYSLAVKETWSAEVVPKWSTNAFPEWNATPAAPWNYALALDPLTDPSHVRIERKKVAADPWVDPPIGLTVPLKEVAGWNLHIPPGKPNRQQTPPLPPRTAALEEALATAPVHEATLVPYGSTHLRLTIFPKG